TVLAGIQGGWELLDRGELEELGLTIDALGQVELEIKIPGGAVVVCHPDGIARDKNGDLVAVEAKALSPGYAKTVGK
ncbi:hypothetical protein, partial [Streptomyces sp. CHA16]|uniref:hypothetical protein n=1 Tax=Streptomyces sp. CHA16 TaxID=2841667 RepID=UPI0020947D0A